MDVTFSKNLKGKRERESNGASRSPHRKKYNYNLLNKPNIISITDQIHITNTHTSYK